MGKFRNVSFGFVNDVHQSGTGFQKMEFRGGYYTKQDYSVSSEHFLININTYEYLTPNIVKFSFDLDLKYKYITRVE